MSNERAVANDRHRHTSCGPSYTLAASGIEYYLIFDGLEDLYEEHTQTLLAFVFMPADPAAGRVHVLMSGTDDIFTGWFGHEGSACTNGGNNAQDLEMFVDRELQEHTVLTHAVVGS